MANWRFNADANTGHAFAILLASIGTPRTLGAPALLMAIDSRRLP